jgi:hypothetical protein
MTSHFKPPDHLSYSSSEDRVWAVLDSFRANPKYKGFDTEGLQNIEYVAASVEKQTIAFEMTTTPILCNKNQVLHGDVAAMLLDTLTSAIDDNIPASTPRGGESQDWMPRGCYQQEDDEFVWSN